jgi:arginine decarboxylase
MGDDGKLQDTGVPAALVNAFFGRFGIVPTRVTDFQVMFLFSIGITKGKWGTLITNLLAFKRHYDANDPVSEVLPELAAQNGARYRNVGLRELGDEMFAYLKKNNPGEQLNRAFETIPVPAMTPRAAFQHIVRNDVELVPVTKIANRVAANAVMPYPPGIPMLMSGENFGGENSPQIGYLRGLQSWGEQFPGFERVTEGAEIEHGAYHVLCVR